MIGNKYDTRVSLIGWKSKLIRKACRSSKDAELLTLSTVSDHAIHVGKQLEEILDRKKNGNKYKILATSGRTNQIDKNILDLDNVKGEITSKKRSTIYIVSDFAEYNSSTLASKFYKNVVINYEDKHLVYFFFFDFTYRCYSDSDSFYKFF